MMTTCINLEAGFTPGLLYALTSQVWQRGGAVTQRLIKGEYVATYIIRACPRVCFPACPRRGATY